MSDPVIMGNNVAGHITFGKSPIEKMHKFELLEKAANNMRARFNELDDQMIAGYSIHDKNETQACYSMNFQEIVHALNSFVTAVNSYKVLYDTECDADGNIDVLAI